jgi:hypothetical protein
MNVALILAALTVPSGRAIAQDHPIAAGPSLRLDDATQLVAPPSKRPFSNIFTAPRLEPRGRQRPSDPQIVEVKPLPGARPRVVCGMTLVPAPRDLDTKMAVQPPQKPDVEYKLRAIAPPVCRQ